jgi:hypothetical protein
MINLKITEDPGLSSGREGRNGLINIQFPNGVKITERDENVRRRTEVYI